MKENKTNFSYTVRILLKRNGKILLLERSPQKGGFSLPGGHVEQGEKPIMAIKRETMEEIGLQIKKKDLELVHILHRRRKKQKYEIIYFYQTKKWTGKISVLEPHKFKAVRWFAKQHLPDRLSTILTIGIKAIRKGKVISYHSEIKKSPKMQ